MSDCPVVLLTGTLPRLKGSRLTRAYPRGDPEAGVPIHRPRGGASAGFLKLGMAGGVAGCQHAQCLLNASGREEGPE